ncbi:nitroreductase family protein [Bacteroidota bacterium]
MEINNLISERWSPVAFSDKQIDIQVINALFEAARWAPSGFNGQPWRFIWGTKGDQTYEQLFELISESNKKWAVTAPILILSMAETIPAGRTNINKYAFFETGMAVSNLLLQATYAGLYAHQMGGYDSLKAKDILNLPESIEPATMIAVGYKGNPEDLPEEIGIRETKLRSRKELDTFVFNKGF